LVKLLIMEHYKNLQLKNLQNEIWIDVYGYDGMYEVSNLGRLKSLKRYVNNGRGGQKLVKERILKQTIKPTKNLSVKLSSDGNYKGFSIGQIVFFSFNTEQSYINYNDCIVHKNKNLKDNRLVNLKLSNKHSKELHSHFTFNNSSFKKNRTKKRKCKICKKTKDQSKFPGYGDNRCNRCKYLKKVKAKNKTSLKNVFKIKDLSTNKTKTYIGYTDKNCPVTKETLLKYANTKNILYPKHNSNHKNPLLITYERKEF